MPELLQVRHLVKHFPVRRGFLRRRTATVHAVDGVSFTIARSETLGLVGESGCGKTTTGRSVLRLIEPTSGEVRFQGEDLLALDVERLRARRRHMQIVFQDPFGSLNPRLTVERRGRGAAAEPRAARRGRAPRAGRARRSSMVGLLPEHRSRFPHEFSGGQRQRIGIARALVLRPKLIVGDEPVSALDVSVQAQVLNLLVRLQRRLELTYLFISHDLAVIRYVSHRVGVMYLGQIVETAPARALYERPLHPYTRALLSAVPVARPAPRRGSASCSRATCPSPMNPPAGCRFHPRCPEAMPRCAEDPPLTRAVATGHLVRCHLYADSPAWTPEAPAPATGAGNPSPEGGRA